MSTVKDFHDLNIWKESRVLVKDVYELLKKFPSSEKYALSDQIRRAIVSVPSNIAEGFDRGSNKEIKQFLMVARGSLAEVYTQVTLAYDLEYINKPDFEKIEQNIIKIRKMINAFIRHLTI